MADKQDSDGPDKPEGGEVVTFPHGDVLPSLSGAVDAAFSRSGMRGAIVAQGRKAGGKTSPPKTLDGSLPLRNPKHERFVLLVASGASHVDAYEQSGHSRDDGNARRLRNLDAVTTRIEWLKAEISRNMLDKAGREAESVLYGRAEAVREAGEVLAAALACEQTGAAVAAVQLKAKLMGLLVERKEVGQPGDFDAMDRAQLHAYITDMAARLKVG